MRPLIVPVLLGVLLALVWSRDIAAQAELPRQPSPDFEARSWTQWGGRTRDFRSASLPLSETWPEGGPRRIWQRELGDGFSALVVEGGAVHAAFRRGDLEVLASLDTETGEARWEHCRRAAHPEGADLGFGAGPRSTPLIVGERVATIGFDGMLSCLHRETGRELWSRQLMSRDEGSFLRFGYSSSPVAFNEVVYAQTGTPGESLVALRVSDGSVAWKRHDYPDSYSSPLVIDVHGQAQLVVFMATHLVGVRPENGDLLWQFPLRDAGRPRMCTPVWCEGSVLFVSSWTEGIALRLELIEGETQVEKVWSSRRLKVGYTNAVRLGDTIFATTTSGETSPAVLTAFRIQDGEILWRSRRFGKTNLTAIGTRLLLLDEDGTLAIATPAEELEVHSAAPILANPAWTVQTVVGNRVYLRDRKNCMALELPLAR